MSLSKDIITSLQESKDVDSLFSNAEEEGQVVNSPTLKELERLKGFDIEPTPGLISFLKGNKITTLNTKQYTDLFNDEHEYPFKEYQYYVFNHKGQYFLINNEGFDYPRYVLAVKKGGSLEKAVKSNAY